VSAELHAALLTIRRAVERDGAPAIWLHDPDSGEAFALLLPEPQPRGTERPLHDAAEAAMEGAGWDPWHHSHLDGGEDEP
jgi:hypothetical protein